jgi:hypothetical protein
MCLQKLTRNEHFFATKAGLGPHILEIHRSISYDTVGIFYSESGVSDK